MKELGRVLGNSSPYRVSFISKEQVRVGTYVVVQDDVYYFGIVGNVLSRNMYLDEHVYVETIDELDSIAQQSDDRNSYIAYINVLGVIDGNDLKSASFPPKPNSKVFLADKEFFEKHLIHDDEKEKYIKLGNLYNTEIPAYINLEQAILRHLAILAITGAGKSNTVAVLLKGIHERAGTALIFDIHGEYVNMRGLDVNLIEPKINPMLLDTDELAGLVGIDMDNAPQMYYILSEEKEKLDEDLKIPKNEEGEIMFEDEFDKQLNEKINYLDALLDNLKDIMADNQLLKAYAYDRNSLFRLVNRLKNLKTKYGSILTTGSTSLLYQIKPGKINVLDLSQVDEDKADVIISHVLTKVLNDRKREDPKVLKAPIVCILEEAHIFASRKFSRRSKYILGRIAREGRKFGVGLWIVSQRPKALDQDILSQMNNMIILKLVEPEDQKHVQSASELLSKELMDYLSGLNPGEAIVLGNITKFPLLVKIDKADVKLSGRDPEVISAWKSNNKNLKRITEDIPL